MCNKKTDNMYNTKTTLDDNYNSNSKYGSNSNNNSNNNARKTKQSHHSNDINLIFIIKKNNFHSTKYSYI